MAEVSELKSLEVAARKAFQDKQWPLAMALWDAVLEGDPNCVVTYADKANALTEQVQLKAAKAIFEQVCQRFPTSIQGAVGLARVAFRQQQWQQVLSYCEQILSRAPNHFQTRILQGNTLLEIGQFEQAEAIFQSAIERFPNRILSYRRLAQLAMHLNQWSLAIHRFQMIAQQFPEDLSGWIGEVNALIQMENFSVAQVKLKAMSREHLGQLPTLRALITTGFYTQEWDFVIAQVKIYSSKHPKALATILEDEKLFTLYSYLVKQLLESRCFTTVESLLEYLTSTSTSPAAITIWTSRTAQHRADHNSAQQYCIQAVQQEQKYAAYLYLQCAQNARQELHYSSALNYCNQVSSDYLQPYTKAKILTARILIRLEQFGRAKKALQTLIKQRPDHQAGYSVLAEVLYHQDHNYGQVIALCNRARRHGASSTQIRLYRSLALLELQEEEKAQRASGRHLKRDPQNRLLLMAHAEVLHQTRRYAQAIATINRWLLAGYFAPIRSSSGKLDIQHIQCNPGYTIDKREQISVVMTAYGYDEMLSIAVASILNQTYRNLELIIVDDGSTDHTFTFLQSLAANDSRIQLIPRAKNGGTYLAKNCGMAAAKGDYMTFMDSDDWLHPQTLERQIDILRNTEAKGVLCRYVRVTERNRIEFKPEGPTRIAPITLCFKREPVLKTIGYFDPIRFSADTEYHSRFKLICGTAGIKEIRFPLLLSKRHDTSLTGSGVLKLKWHGPDLACERYRANFRKWHNQLQQSNESAYLPHPLDYRRFEVPTLLT